MTSQILNKILENYRIFNYWSIQHLATLVCILLLILVLSFLAPFASKEYLQIHEFGHGLAALILAQDNLKTGENLTLSWVFSEQGPVQTKASWPGLTKLHAAVISVSGGFMEMFIAFLIYFLTQSVTVSSGKKVRDGASIMFFVGAIFFSLFYSILFADTDGFALGHIMSAKFGVFWEFIVTIVNFVIIPIAAVSLGIAICIDVVEILERNKFIIKFNILLTKKYIKPN